MFISRRIWILIALAIAVVTIAGVVYLLKPSETLEVLPEEEVEVIEEVAPELVAEAPVHTVIGYSVEGRAIDAYTYGDGVTKLLFVGGVHGGYEWNSVYLAYRFQDHIQENPGFIPANISVTIIPSLNPDGLFDVTGVEGRFTLNNVPDVTDKSGVGRFNANDVDLNRNFDCKWQSESSWRGSVVSAGTAAFSEPEAAALRDFVIANSPAAVVFWHSMAGSVYASECEAGVLPQTIAVMNAYANTAGYAAVESFDAYPVTGDAEGWLASIGIPAITVELTTHESTEWEKNLAGVQALLNLYSE